MYLLNDRSLPTPLAILLTFLGALFGPDEMG